MLIRFKGPQILPMLCQAVRAVLYNFSACVVNVSISFTGDFGFIYPLLIEVTKNPDTSKAATDKLVKKLDVKPSATILLRKWQYCF